MIAETSWLDKHAVKMLFSYLNVSSFAPSPLPKIRIFSHIPNRKLIYIRYACYSQTEDVFQFSYKKEAFT